MVVGGDDSAVEWTPLPDSELVFGLSGDACHAVAHTTAVAAIGEGLICDAAAVALCGELCGLASAWGAYERGSRYLSRPDVCQRCVWIVAGARGELADQVALTRPKEQHAAAVSAALGDIEVGERLLQAILDDPDISGSLDLLVGRFKRSHRTDLLALAAQHLPGVLVCEECSEGMGSSAHEGQRCPAESAVCLTCTPHAGPYAGEWEGSTLQECIVDTPCSVLRALCDNYEIALPSRANPSDRRGIDIMTNETPPELENDRTAMMLGLVPDKRTPEQRLLDCILTDGESAKYRYGASALPHSEEEFEAVSDVADRTGVARDDISAERSGRKRPLWAVPAEEIQSRRDEWLPHLEGKTTAEIHRWAGFEGLPVATAEVWLWAVVHPALDLTYGPDGRWGLENGPQEVPTQLRSLVERWRASGNRD